MITKEQYEQAINQRDDAERIIQEYTRQQMEAFEQRMKDNPVFADDELIYSRYSLCPCGHGVAYPRGCGPFHYWDCSAILKGIHDKSVEHCGQLPFTTCDIKSEQGTQTTRGVFRPKPAESA